MMMGQHLMTRYHKTCDDLDFRRGILIENLPHNSESADVFYVRWWHPNDDVENYETFSSISSAMMFVSDLLRGIDKSKVMATPHGWY